MSERALLLMDKMEEPENAALRLTDMCRHMLEEAGLTTDEGSLVCGVALMRIVVLRPENFGPIGYRIVWHEDGYRWLE